MAGEDPKKPSNKDDDWAEIPTEVTLRSQLTDKASPPLPSVVDPAERDGGDETEQYEAGSTRGLITGAALPKFLDAYLDVLSGPDVREPFALTMVRTVIGRGPSADVRMRDAKMSKRHASIHYVGSEFRVRDEKTTNGTYLNGSRVVEYAIRSGDKLLVGDTLFKFRLGSLK